jgi:hypothetical protein
MVDCALRTVLIVFFAELFQCQIEKGAGEGEWLNDTINK